MPTWRWFGGVLVTSTLLILIVPDVGCSKPAIMRSVVVLPQPLGPRNETNSPRSTSRLKFSTAVDWAKLFRTLVRSRNAITTPLQIVDCKLQIALIYNLQFEMCNS